MSIYAGELYIAEADPLLTAAGEAARAGLLVDYYLERCCRGVAGRIEL